MNILIIKCACTVIQAQYVQNTTTPICRASTGMGPANQVVMLGETDDGFGLTSDPVHFLDSPVLVTGALLLTNGECSLASPLQVSISSEDDAGKIILIAK